MEEYNYDAESVEALKKWAESASFPKQIRLSKAENILDVNQYVQSNLIDIERHYPDELYHPAIVRLYRLKAALEGGEEQPE